MATTTTEATKTSTNGEDQKQSQNLRHQEVGHKSLLQSDDLYQVFYFSLNGFIQNSAFFLNSIQQSNIKKINTVYIGDKCVSKGTRINEGTQGSDSKTSLVRLLNHSNPHFPTCVF